MEQNWKNSLMELREGYSDNQIAVLLGLSHGAVAGRMLRFGKTGYHKPLSEIYERIKKGEDRRKIFFEKWCERVNENKYGMLYRFMRESLGLTDKEIFKAVFGSDKKLVSFANLCSYANNTNIMPRKLYEKIVFGMRQSGYSFDENKILKDYELLKKQIQKFTEKELKHRCPSIIKLFLTSNNLKGTEAEILVYKKIKELYIDCFMGATLTKNFKKRDDVDILVFDQKRVMVIEVKGFRNIKGNTLRRRLKWTLSRLRRLKMQYPEIGKTICILPFIDISKEWKHKFNSKDTILIDKSEFETLDRGRLESRNRTIFQSYYSLGGWLNKWKLSHSTLEILLKDTEYFRNVRNMARPEYKIEKATSTLQYVDSLIKKHEPRKLHFMINKKAYFYDKEIEFWRNVRKVNGISLSQISKDLFGNPIKNKNRLATLETGKRSLKWLKNLYIEYLKKRTNNKELDDKIKSRMKYDKERWELAEDFPMIVGLVESKEDRLEKKIASLLMDKCYKVITNALINDKSLSKMTLNFHHPEADVIGLKRNEFIVVGCRDFSKCNSSQFIVSAEAEIDTLAEWMEDGEFTKAVFAVAANISEEGWKTLETYAKSQNVELWRFPEWIN